MRQPRETRVLDAAALIGLFQGHRALEALLNRAESGAATLLLPTTAIAEAEGVVLAGQNGWNAILLTKGVQALPLSEHTAIEVGGWPGTLSIRHAVHEASAVRGMVVTTRPGEYTGLPVPLQVI